MTGELVRGDSRTSPGGIATYSVWLWSTTKARHVTASVSVFGKDVKAPVLSLCQGAKGHVCPVGALPANQQFELMVSSKIGKNAPTGEQIGVTINVQGDTDTGGALSPAEASVATVLGQSNSSPSPPTTITEPPVTIPANPGLPGTTVTPGSISSLFPVVTPSSSPSPSADQSDGPKKRGGTKAVTVASSSPIDPKLIGGQLAGLAVLAAAITMVVARLSLRTPQAATSAGTAVAAAPPEPAPAPEPAKTPEPAKAPEAAKTDEPAKADDAEATPKDAPDKPES